MALDLILRLAHIIPAIMLAGGILFMWSTMLPALGGVEDETRNAILEQMRARWSKIVMACSGMLLVTGLYNAVRAILANEFTGGPYHMYVTLKLILAEGIMFITAKLSGRSDGARQFREKMPFWMAVNSGLVLFLILIASTMRVTERVPKEAENVEAPSVQVEAGN